MPTTAQLRHVIKRSAVWLACSTGRKQPDGVRCLLYHSVSRDHARSPDQMTVSPDLFEVQMKMLKEHGMVVCDAQWVVQQLRNRTALPPRTVVLTFDDGLADFYEVAHPILQRFSYPATVFLIAGALEGASGTAWHQWPTGYMTMEQVRELQRDGLVNFGCHSVTHAPLTRLPDDAVRREVEGGKHRLEAILGRSVDLFAYPFGVREMWDDRIPRAVERAGFLGAYTSIFGLEDADPDVYRLRRSRVSWTEDPASFERLLRGCYDWYAKLQELQVRLSSASGVISPAVPSSEHPVRIGPRR